MSRSWNPSTLGAAILVLATAAALWSINRGFPELDGGKELPGIVAPVPQAPGNPPVSTEVPDVTVRNLDGQVVFRGTVDLAPTLERIARGDRLHFHDDGSPFHNREHHLPPRPAGYYTEYIHPTPNLAGPGPQRIVTGRDGEIYYTPDHYRTLVRVR